MIEWNRSEETQPILFVFPAYAAFFLLFSFSWPALSDAYYKNNLFDSKLRSLVKYPSLSAYRPKNRGALLIIFLPRSSFTTFAVASARCGTKHPSPYSGRYKQSPQHPRTQLPPRFFLGFWGGPKRLVAERLQPAEMGCLQRIYIRHYCSLQAPPRTCSTARLIEIITNNHSGCYCQAQHDTLRATGRGKDKT